jgi:hypothetical protein
MSPRFRAASPLTLLALAVVLTGVAQGRPAADGISGNVVAGKGFYRYTDMNTGTTTHQFFAAFAPQGTTFAQVQGTKGQCRIGEAANVLRCANLALEPGQSMSVTGSADAATAGTAHMECASADGVRDVCTGTLSATAEQETPPCECKTLDVFVSSFSSAQVTKPVRGSTSNVLTFNWEMGCSAGTGDDCKGAFTVSAPKRTDLKRLSPDDPTVSCAGSCATNDSKLNRGKMKFKFVSKGSFDLDKRAGKTSTFSVRKYCFGADGTKKLVGRERIRLVFGPAGFLDRSKSDLNGNGKPDGKEKT